MKRFKLPRKVKKSLKGSLWLYPSDEKGNSLMAHPAASQEDYIAMKHGIVRNILHPKNAKSEKKIFRDEIDREIIVSDEKLRSYVDDIIREDLRNSSYNTLIEAKNNPKGIIAYYNFVNAYHLFEKGDHPFGNICCLSIERAKGLLETNKRILRRQGEYSGMV